MTSFTHRAQQLLDTALAGPAGSEITVLVGEDGAVRLCVDSDWPLDSLMRERGARAAYRVRSFGGTVRVEGREGFRTCVLESSRPGETAAANLLLAGTFPQFA